MHHCSCLCIAFRRFDFEEANRQKLVLQLMEAAGWSTHPAVPTAGADKAAQSAVELDHVEIESAERCADNEASTTCADNEASTTGLGRTPKQREQEQEEHEQEQQQEGGQHGDEHVEETPNLEVVRELSRTVRDLQMKVEQVRT
jgi:hypothetical protein